VTKINIEMRQPLPILLLFLFPFMLLAQSRDEVIDSLIVAYEEATTDEVKLVVGQTIADSLLHTDRVRAKKYGLETFPLARVSDDPYLKIYGYFLQHLFVKQDLSNEQFNEFEYLDSAQMVFEQYEDVLEPDVGNELAITLLSARATNFYNKGEMKEAMVYYQEALSRAKDLEDYTKIAFISYNIAICHYVLNSYEEAKVQLKYTYKIAKEHGIKKIESSALNVLGVTYQVQDSLEKAKIYIGKALALAMESKDEQAVRETHLTMGIVMESLNELDSAYYYLEESLAVTKGKDDPLIEAQIYLYQANVESKRGNPDNARTLFSKATQLNDQIDRKEVGFLLAMDLAELEYTNKNYKEAYDLLAYAAIEKDSFISVETKSEVQELQLKYGKAEADRKIALQELDLVKKQRRIGFLTAGLGLTLTGLLIFLGFYRNSKRAELLTKAELSLKEAKLKSIEKEKSILALSSTLEGQEAERSRIANDLHDGLGGLLSSVKAHYGKIQKQLEEIEQLDVFNSAEEMLDTACEEVRRISHNLMPPLLRSHGLPSALQGLANRYQSDQFIVKLDVRNMVQRLTDTQEVFLYRITQELLANVSKHANCGRRSFV